MAKPTVQVEIAFDAGYTGTPTWTDVTSDVWHEAGISIDKWRPDESAVCAPSSCSLTLKNSDGRYTPGKTGGAHYPNVKKGRRIRVRSTVNAVTTTRFLGYINDWAVEWPGRISTVATCRVTASSRMARLGKTVELRSIVEEEILLDAPVAYYTLGEPEGSLIASDSSGHSQPNLTQVGPGVPIVFGNAVGPGTDGLTGATFPGDRNLTGVVNAPNPAPSGFSFDAFVVTSDSGTQRDLLGTNTATVGAVFTLMASGHLRAAVAAGAVETGTVFNDGGTHHMAIAMGATNFEFFVDGISIGTAAHGNSPGAVLDVTLGNIVSTGIVGLIGSLFHVALYDVTLSSTRVAAHASAGLTGFAGETAAARITRYAAFADIPAGEVDAETGDVLDLAHIDTTGKTVLAVMREVETTESGVLFDAGDGTLKFHDRSHRYGAASAFTLPAANVVEPPTPVLDDQLMVNDMTATGSTGIKAHVTDDTSLAESGPYRQSLDLATSNADEPLEAASWRVGRYATPAVRISSVDVQLSKTDATVTAAILAAEPGTKFTITGLSASNAPATSMDLFVEGMSEHINATEHRVTLRTSPAEVFDVWILGDATYGVLGTTTRLGY